MRCAQLVILILILNWCQVKLQHQLRWWWRKNGGTFLFPGRRSAHHHSEQELILPGPRRLNVEEDCWLAPKPKVEEVVLLASTSPAWTTFLKPCHVLNRRREGKDPSPSRCLSAGARYYGPSRWQPCPPAKNHWLTSSNTGSWRTIAQWALPTFPTHLMGQNRQLFTCCFSNIYSWRHFVRHLLSPQETGPHSWIHRRGTNWNLIPALGASRLSWEVWTVVGTGVISSLHKHSKDRVKACLAHYMFLSPSKCWVNVTAYCGGGPGGWPWLLFGPSAPLFSPVPCSDIWTKYMGW